MKSVSIIALAPCIAAVPKQPSFDEWAGMYGINGGDDKLRATFETNVAEIDRLNGLNTTAVFGVNQFSGMTNEEFSATMLGEIDEDDTTSNHSHLVVDNILEESAMASSIDWVARGGVTPVKDQGHCSSCWAFGSAGVVEAVHKIETGETVILSEQQLIDCQSQSGGCSHGADTTKSLQWMKSNTLCTESSYPYRQRDEQCSSSCSSSHIHVRDVQLLSKTASALASGLNKSPVAVSVHGSSMQHYHSGIMEGSNECTTSHSVLAVGYASNYWKIKNSWGKDWGEHGYIRIGRGGTDGCGKFGVLHKNGRVPVLSSSPSPSPHPSPSPAPSPEATRRRRRRRRRHSEYEAAEMDDEVVDDLDGDVVV